MKLSLTRLVITVLIACGSLTASAQLSVTNAPDALALAQRLVGNGVTISNVTFTGNLEMAGFFNNAGGTNINIDSGIVLTNGRASARSGIISLMGNSFQNADNNMGLSGDADLTGISGFTTHDACVLQFDFVPLGDSIRFNYVFSSEEYPDYVCQFNDAFAFLITGPGIVGTRNIALIPNTTLPVTINHINDVSGCGGNPFFPQYYVNNTGNPYLTHNGHTTVLTALERVIPCQTYTLKLVIADAVDWAFDSGVFLEARSLSSNAISMNNQTQTDPVNGLSYLVEGCAVGAFDVCRPRKEVSPMVVNLSYVGTATNGIDYQLMPSSVTIPANDSFVRVNIFPLIDGIPEGIEEIKVYALAGCATGNPTDSTIIEIRDYDILSLSPADTALICRNSSIQLVATTGYTVYQWVADPTLSNPNIRDPLATPVNSGTNYICTATVGTCNARDSVFIQWKDLEFISKTDVNCRNGNNGQIKVSGGPEWAPPRGFSLDGINWQTDSTFSNLAAGTYWVKMRDGTCVDSIPVNITQAYPDLLIDNLTKTDASCSGNPDGTITAIASGGNGIYTYSIDGINFQSANQFNVAGGSYTLTIRDANGCLASQSITVGIDNTVTVDAGVDYTLCEGTSYLIPAISNAVTYSWSPAGSLDNNSLLTPTASPTVTTKYYLTATTGICSRIDSLTLFVRPAPVADAGPDVNICYGKTLQLHGAGGVSYEWSPATYFVSGVNVQDPEVKATNDITYSLMVSDAFNCRSLVPDLVKVDVTPSVRIFAGNDTIAAMNQPLQLNVREMSAAGVTGYSWTPAIPLTGANTASPVAELTSDQRFVVVGTTPDGCQGIDDILVKVYKGPEIYVPSGFTPNNDGLNDVLHPIAVGIKEFRFFQVFNRWGQLIYSTKDPQRGWDGRLNGTEQATGTFVWMAEAVDYRGNLITRKGVVTIIR